MAKRIDIIKQFKTDLEAKLNTANGYNTDILMIRLGYASFSTIAPKPGLWYWVSLDTAEEDMMDDQFLRILNFKVVGYTEDEDIINYENILYFAEDIENFIRSTDWTHSTNTRLGNMNFAAGESDQGYAQFDLSFLVYYYQDFE
jgi:hypothetical protein